MEIYKFSSNVTEESLELPANVIAVLKNPTVSDFITGLLKEKEIQALFIYDHKKSSNEVLVVGAGSNSVSDAGKVLQNVIQERSLKLTYENTLVRESHQWKTFLSNLTSTKKIGIFTDHYSSTLWICGVAEFSKTYSLALIVLNSFLTRTPFYMTPFILTKEKNAGMEEGLDQCVAKLKEIEKTVQKDSISIDKPRMKTFILQEKGPKCEQ